MEVAHKKVGFALTGSFCTLSSVLSQMEVLVKKDAEVIPIFSYNVNEMDTRFMSVSELRSKVIQITGRAPICSIKDAEPIGPKKLLDILVIAPCTGNTLSKLSLGVTDTPVLMAAKAHLRNNRPLVVAVSTNDGLGTNAKNIGQLMNVKNIFFVPFGQDGCKVKQNSLVSRMDLILPTVEAALENRQFQPVLLGTQDLI